MTSIANTSITPLGSNFSDAFWDEQHKGVDIIQSRLRKARDTCEQIKKLYELRANIEQDYGERLLKLAASSRIGEFEENSFAETLSRIPSVLETTARAHIDLSQQLKDHLESPLDGFMRDQKEIRRVENQKIENSKQLKKLHESDVARAKDDYSIESKNLTTLEKELFSLIDNYNDSNNKDILKDISKIEKEIEEQKRVVAVADQVYKRSVDNLNSTNEKWLNDWTQALNKFQEMEVKRISYLRDTLWSFANMMTSTFNIDEECSDRIRTALEVTDVTKDISHFVHHYGTGSQIPAPVPYEILYQPTTINIQSLLKHKPVDIPLSGSIYQPTNVLTNPDEELKSIDRQLKQLEVHPSESRDFDYPSPEDPDHGVTTAMKEVELILNQTRSIDDDIHPIQEKSSVISHNSNQSHPSNVIASPPLINPQQFPASPQSTTDELSSNTYSALNKNEDQNQNTKSPTALSRFKPVLNPAFANTGENPLENNKAVGPRTSSLNLKPQMDLVDDEEEDEDTKAYQNRMPRPPPKDEKWMISSIRRPQQVPVKPLNGQFFEPHSSQSSVVLPPLPNDPSNPSPPKEGNGQEHIPKLHRPVVPLSIDIPNPTNDPSQTIPQQRLNDARHLSHIPPNPEFLQQQPLNYHTQPPLENNIRPAPWQDDPSKNYYTGYPPAGPRGSSLKLSNPYPVYPEEETKKQRFNIKAGLFSNAESPTKPNPPKETKSGRFSLGIFGNKKDKKKEKEQAINNFSTLSSGSFNPPVENLSYSRPQSQQAAYPLQESDKKSNHSGSQVRSSTHLQPATNSFISYAKAQWAFEATIDGEMSFDAQEVLGVRRKQADGWWVAERLSTGQTGLVPGNYMIDNYPPPF